MVFGGSGSNFIQNASNQAGAAGTLTIGSGITIRGKNGALYNNYTNGSLVNQGTINIDTAGGTIQLGGSGTSTFTNQGTVNVSAGVLNLYGNLTLAGLGTLNRTGGTVNLGGTLDLQSSLLNLDATTGSWNLLGGTIKNGTLNESGGAKLVLTNSGGALTSMTVNGDLDLTQQANTGLGFYGGLVLNGTVFLGNDAGTTYGRLYFGDTSSNAGSLTGTGTVVFGGSGSNFIQNASNQAGAAGTLTIGSGITIRGKNGALYNNYTNGSLVNQGTINIDTAGGTIQLGGSGTSTFTNQGTVNVSAGVLNLYGNLTLAGLGTLNRTGGTVNLGGTLDLQSSLLNLDATTGSWNLLGGTIKNGTLNESGGAKLVLTNSGGALTSMTVNGDLDLTQQANTGLGFYGGLVLNGTVFLGNDAGTTYGRLYFGGNRSQGGDGIWASRGLRNGRHLWDVVATDQS